jgi:hypothetical protein
MARVCRPEGHSLLLEHRHSDLEGPWSLVGRYADNLGSGHRGG